MKKLLSLLSLTLVLNNASAALPFFDPFADMTVSGGTDYAIDSGLAGQTNSGEPKPNSPRFARMPEVPDVTTNKRAGV